MVQSGLREESGMNDTKAIKWLEATSSNAEATYAVDAIKDLARLRKGVQEIVDMIKDDYCSKDPSFMERFAKLEELL